MAKFAIWGYNKFGEAKCYALYVDQDEIPDYIKRGEADGWTQLTPGVRSQPELFPETPESDSSESPPSPRKKRAQSGTSEDASLD